MNLRDARNSAAFAPPSPSSVTIVPAARGGRLAKLTTSVALAARPEQGVDPETPGRLVEQAASALGPIDVLIPNAGYAVQRAYTDVDLQTWDRTLAVNLRAPFLLAQATVPSAASQSRTLVDWVEESIPATSIIGRRSCWTRSRR